MVSLKTIYRVYKTGKFVYDVYTKNPIQMAILYEIYCISRCAIISKIQQPVILTMRQVCACEKKCVCDEHFIEIGRS